MAGTVLRNYAIPDKLGEGGVGEVWRARYRRPQHLVAKKNCVLGALDHANVVAIYDVGEGVGHAYIVSELMEGGVLRTVLDRGSPPLRKTGEIASLMVGGMAAAYALGIDPGTVTGMAGYTALERWKTIHPSQPVPEIFNLHVTPDGQAYAYNYGIAQADFYVAHGLD